MGRCVHEADEKWGGESKGADEKWGGESVTTVSIATPLFKCTILTCQKLLHCSTIRRLSRSGRPDHNLAKHDC